MTETHLSELRFDSLDLVPEVARGISGAGFVRATPVQASTLPIALSGKDVAGQAQTGTGKTAAFLVALFQRLLTNPPASGRSDDRLVRLVILDDERDRRGRVEQDRWCLPTGRGGRHR